MPVPALPALPTSPANAQSVTIPQEWVPLPTPHHAWWQWFATTTASTQRHYVTASTTNAFAYMPQVTAGTNSLTFNVWYPYQPYEQLMPQHGLTIERVLPLGAHGQRDAERPRRPRVEGSRLRASEERALALLRTTLSPEQWMEFEAHRIFHVRSASGRRFRIEYGLVGNVVEVDAQDDRRELGVYCCHPREDVPLPDVLVAQKLHIEHDLERFLATANRHR